MQHFLNLDKCFCGAYRYLAVREHKKSYEVYLIHHTHQPNTQDQRKYAKLASISKRQLNIHDTRSNEKCERTLKLSSEQEEALRSILKSLDTTPGTETDANVEKTEMAQTETLRSR